MTEAALAADRAYADPALWIARLPDAAVLERARALTADTRAKVLPSRANQPVVSDVGACAALPRTGTRPWAGRMPNGPQKLAGTRTELPVPVPSATSHSPAAIAEA